MMPRRPPRLLVDVTQYVNWPATSGVQRVLFHLAEDWSGDTVDACFGFINGRRYVTGPISRLALVIGSVFSARGAREQASSRAVQDALSANGTQNVPIKDLERHFDAYLLPEPTLRRDNLDVAERLQRSSATSVFFLYYDALPLTHPQFFAGSADRAVEFLRYHQSVVSADNVAFISQATKEVFELRLARRSPRNAIVVRPGADGLPRRHARPLSFERPTFAVLGTVEPRKRHRLVLEAFERLWGDGRDYRLVLLGAPGAEQPDFLDRLRKLSLTPRLEWIEHAGDDDVANALAASAAMVFVPVVEGYGLPLVESLASGCPVIVSADLPALEGLSNAGQTRLDAVTVESVASAVGALADPASNAASRRAMVDIRLPTWKQFASDIEQWISGVLRAGAGRSMNSPQESEKCLAQAR
jgi:glycosyltransferase involved in cell wall biosynthesis